jgi:hypothetical protein
MDRFFRHATMLWAGVFLLLAAGLGAALVTVPETIYVPVWAGATIATIAAGIGASVLLLRSVIRRLDIGFRFTSSAAV